MKEKPLYLQSHQPIETRLEDLLKRMTREEKIAQLQAVFKEPLVDNRENKERCNFDPQKTSSLFPDGLGHLSAPFQDFTAEHSARFANQLQKFMLKKTRLGIPVLIDGEALHGCIGVNCTSYPQAIGLAATWNVALLERIAGAIAAETRSRGVFQVLSPVCDIARDVRAGRTEETYGEDPMLVTRMAVAFVKGIQSKRIITTPKHFVANFVGDGGRDSHPIHFSERLLREIYLPPYEAVFREAGALSVMSAYHSLEGVPCSANRWLLTQLLRKEWGFKGMVVSDHYATVQIHKYHCTAEDKAQAALQALSSGMDVELPYSDCFKHLGELVRKGRLPVKILDQAVRRVLYIKFWTGLFDRPYVHPAVAAKITNCPAHRQLALDAARQAIVLLRNDGILPLKPKIKTLAVLGPNAAEGQLGGYSAKTNAIAPLDGIRKLTAPYTRILHAEGCPLTKIDRSGIRGAVKLAKQAEAVVIFAGNSHATQGESADRCNLDLPGVQEELIIEAAKANPNIVVVLIGGSAVTMGRWINNVRAVVMGWYPGQAGGTALAEVLFGKVNPGGKLPITFPKVTAQCPLYYNTKPSGRGYTYGDLPGQQAQFPFGHGLSYTQFDYLHLRVRRSGAGKKLRYDLAADIKNTGRRTGDETVQLYIRDEYSLRSRPLMELKGWRRVTLKPGQKTTVRFTLTWRDLAYLGDDLKPTLEPGNIKLMIGSSSQDIRLHYGTHAGKAVEAENYEGVLVQPAPPIAKAPYPARNLRYSTALVLHYGRVCFTDSRDIHKNQDGLLYLRTRLLMKAAGQGRLLFSSDGPVRIWVNARPVICVPDAANPLDIDQYKYKAPVQWQKGANEVVFAVHTNHGLAWGVACCGVLN